MKTRLFLLLIFVMSMAWAQPAPLVQSNNTGGGDWTNPATWAGGVVPTAADSVFVRGADSVWIPTASSLSVAALTVDVTSGVSGTRAVVHLDGTAYLLIAGNAPKNRLTLGDPSGANRQSRVNVGNGIIDAFDIIFDNTGGNSERCILTLNNGQVLARRDITLNGASTENLIQVFGSGTIEVGDDFEPTTSEFTPGNSTVVYNGTFPTGRQFYQGTFYNLVLAGTQNKFMTGATTVTNQFTAQSATTNFGGSSITVNGLATIQAGATVTDSSNNGSYTFKDLLTVAGQYLDHGFTASGTSRNYQYLENGVQVTGSGRFAKVESELIIRGGTTGNVKTHTWSTDQFGIIGRDIIIDTNNVLTMQAGDTLKATDDLLCRLANNPSNVSGSYIASNGSVLVGSQEVFTNVLPFTSALVDFTTNPNTVVFVGNSFQFTPNKPFYNLKMASSGTAAQNTNDLVVNELFQVSAGTFNPGSNNWTTKDFALASGAIYTDGSGTGSAFISGTTTIEGNFIPRGTFFCDGNITLMPSGTWSTTNQHTFNLRSNPITVSGAINFNGGIVITNGAQVTFLNPISTVNALQVLDNSTFTNQGLITTPNTVQLIYSSSATSTLNGPLSIGMLTLNNGTLVQNGQAITIKQSNNNQSTAGNAEMFVNGTFQGDGLVSFLGTSTNNVAGTGTILFDDVTFNGNSQMQSTVVVKVSGVLTQSAGTLVTGGALTLTATSPTQYGQINPNSGILSGAITFEKVLVDSTDGGWRHLSFPINSTNIKTAVSGVFLRGSESGFPSTYYNAWNYNDAAVAGTGNWFGPNLTNVPTSTQRRAFAVFSDNSTAPFAINAKITATGNSPIGTMSTNRNYPVELWTSAVSGGNNWNFMPQDLPFGLQVGPLLFANGTVISGFVNYYNSNTAAYQSLTLAGNPNDVIPPFQAYWVEAIGNGNMVIDNDVMGTLATSTVNGFKTSENLDVFALRFSLPNGWSDQVKILFHADATSGYDNGMEALKQMSPMPDMANLYAVDHNQNLSWNALPYQDNQVVPVAFTAGVFGNTYTLTPDFSQTTNGWQIYLKDLHTNTTTLLNGSNGYTFTHDANAPEQRFELLFTNSTLGDEELPATSKMDQVFVYQQGGNNFVHFPNSMMGNQATIEVMALSGQLISTQEVEISGATTAIALGDMPSAWYIVRISHPQGVLTHKVAR